MTRRPVVLALILTSTLTACSEPAPPPTAKRALAPASAPEPENAHGLSRDVSIAADDLFTYFEDNLLGNSVREPSAGEARRQLAALRIMNQTAEDRSVTLLLAMWMSKDNQRAGLVSMGGAGLQDEIDILTVARDRCYDELMGWLEYRSVTTSLLQNGHCLAEAKQAAAVLGL